MLAASNAVVDLDDGRWPKYPSGLAESATPLAVGVLVRERTGDTGTGMVVRDPDVLDR